MKPRILALTGIRSEYDLLQPVLSELEARGAKVGVIACGAHLSALHGRSVRLIEADGFRVAARLPNLSGTGEAGRVRSTGRLIAALAAPLARERPDLLLVLGDREEALAGAVAASYLSIPVAHIGGGDDTAPSGGDVDEGVRHAITKLSHLHFAVAAPHAARLRRLGEEPWRVRFSGSPGVDKLRAERPLSRAELARRTGLPVDGDYAVVIHHALSSVSPQAARAEMAACLQACRDAGLTACVGAPNSDPGFEAVLAAVAAEARRGGVRPYRNLPRREFVSLLRHARCLVGNSSLAFHEAPSLGLPCVNAGERQKGRLNAGNVAFCAPRRAPLAKAVRRAAFDAAYRARVKKLRSPYGDGRAAARIAAVLLRLPPRERLLAKRITY